MLKALGFISSSAKEKKKCQKIHKGLSPGEGMEEKQTTGGVSSEDSEHHLGFHAWVSLSFQTSP
jgi:hypothetical protein